MSAPSTYRSLPGSYEQAKPLLDQALQQVSASAGFNRGSTKQPYPPRSLVVKPFASGLLLASWELPVKASDVVGFNLYLGSEFTVAFFIRNRAQMSQLFQQASTGIWVSCVNAAGVQSQKIGGVINVGGATFSYTQDFIQRSQKVGR